MIFWKRRIVDCIRRIRRFAAHCSEVERIVIRLGIGLADMRSEELTIIRIFGRRFNGIAVDVSSLNGGLSRSRVLKVVVRDGENGVLAAAAAKVSTLTDVSEEARRYRSDVTRLTPGGFPQMMLTINAGAGNYGGLFYGLVSDKVESVFDKLATGVAEIESVPASIRSVLVRWYESLRIENVTVAQIRRKFIGDIALNSVREHLEGVDILHFERQIVRAGCCCQHGDLHGANIVFGSQDQPMLIVFGDVGQSFSSADAVTLELSTIFHSQRRILPAGWPRENEVENWVKPELFSEGCTFPAFIKACRSWALAVAASPEEVIAVAYGYAMRQLKYQDTDKMLARALIRACITALAVNSAPGGASGDS
jgi:hypothetical protein